MRTTNHIETRLFHHTNISASSLFGYGIPPTCLVLMYIGTMEKQMFSIQPEASVLRPMEPTEPKVDALLVEQPLTIIKTHYSLIYIRCRRTP